MKILEYIRFRRRNSFQQNGHFGKVLIVFLFIFILNSMFIIKSNAQSYESNGISKVTAKKMTYFHGYGNPTTTWEDVDLTNEMKARFGDLSQIGSIAGATKYYSSGETSISYYALYNDGSIKKNGQQEDISDRFPNLSDAKNISVSISRGWFNVGGGTYTWVDIYNYYVFYNDGTSKYTTYRDDSRLSNQLLGPYDYDNILPAKAMAIDEKQKFKLYSNGVEKLDTSNNIVGDVTEEFHFDVLKADGIFYTNITSFDSHDRRTEVALYGSFFLNTTPNLTITIPSQNKYFGNNVSTRRLTGTIQDADNDSVVISATIGGQTATTTVTNTSTAKTWTLEFPNTITQGTYSNIVVTANDGKGGTDSKTYTGTIYVDRTNPTATFSQNGQAAWTNSNISTTISTTDTGAGASGVKQWRYRLSTDNGTTYGGWTAYNPSATINLTTSGQHRIQVEVEDNAGNINTITSNVFNIDKIAPPSPGINYTTPVGYNGSWTKENVIFELSNVTDTGGSGIQKRQYKIGTGSWIDYNAAVTLSADINSTVYSRAIDNAGNISSETARDIKIDKTPPNVFTPSVEHFNENSITLRSTTTDSLAGLHSEAYRFYQDGELKRDWGNNQHVYTDLLPNTSYLFLSEARDLAGNNRASNSINKATLPNKPYIESFDLVTDTQISGNINNNNTSNNPEFYIQRAEDENFTLNVITIHNWSSSTTFTAEDLDTGKTYYFRVKARNSDEDETEWSEVLSVDTNYTPEITNVNPQTDVILQKDSEFTLTGKAWDKDGDSITIKAMANDIEKILTIPVPPTNEPLEDNWQLTWEWDELIEGIYTNIEISVEDMYTADTFQWINILTIDKTPPEIQISHTPDVKTLKEVQSTITFTDNLTDILQHKWGEGTYPMEWFKEGNGQIFEPGHNPILTLEYKTYTFYAEDEAGNAALEIADIQLSYRNKYLETVEAVELAEKLETLGTYITADTLLSELEGVGFTLLPDIEALEDLRNRLTMVMKNIIKKAIEDKFNELDPIVDVIEEKESQDLIDEANQIIDELQDLIDSLPDNDADKPDYQERLDEYKDRVAAIQELINIRNSLRMQIENADIDFSVEPALLVLEHLPLGQEYYVIVTDLDTGEVLVNTTSTGGNIELHNTKAGHSYKVDLEGYYQGEKLAERSFVKQKPDTIPPKLQYAYMLDGVLYVVATDNHRLHDTAYAFRIIGEEGTYNEIPAIEINPIYSPIAWTQGEDAAVTSIPFQALNRINVNNYPKTVINRIRDASGNTIEKYFSVTRSNEVLYGADVIPKEIIDLINDKNTPPSSGGSSKPSQENKERDIVIVNPVNPSIDKELEGALEKDKVIINPIDTPTNSQEGGIEINFRNEFSKLNELLKKELGEGETNYRIVITEQNTNQLVYTSFSNRPERLMIPQLQDSTKYNIRISVEHDKKQLAFRDIETMTYDRTPPVLERVIVQGDTLQVVASDNIAMHSKSFQYSITSSAITKEELGKMLANYGSSFELLAYDWQSNVWTEKSRISNLDTGAKVRVIVRDHAENFTVAEVEVKEGIQLESMNGDHPLGLSTGEEYDIDQLIRKILEEYNHRYPEDPYDFTNYHPNNFTLKSSNPSIATFENGKLVTKEHGTVVITLTDKTTGKIYMYSITVSRNVNFDRRIIVQVNSETELTRAFSGAIKKYFGNQKVEFKIIEEQEEMGFIYENIYSAPEKEGIATILASSDNREIPLYILVVKDQYPKSDVEIIITNLAYVLAKGDRLDITDVSVFYNELYEETKTEYLVTEGNSNVLEIKNNVIHAKEEGIGYVSVIDLANNRIEEIDFRVTNIIKTQQEPFEDIKNHWAENMILDLLEKGVVQGYAENEYKPNQAATKEEFLTMLSKVKTLERSESSYKERRNEIPLTIDNSDWSYYYIKDSLNGLSLFEKEFVLGKNPDFTQEITREEAAGILAMALDLKVDENRTANFKDINTTLHRKEIEAVYANNIMSGYNNDAFGPTNQLTRAELAAVFHKILTNDLARQLIKK